MHIFDIFSTHYHLATTLVTVSLLTKVTLFFTNLMQVATVIYMYIWTILLLFSTYNYYV